MYKFLAIIAISLWTISASAQDKKCEGPQDLCDEIIQLQQTVNVYKTVAKSADDKAVAVTKDESVKALAKERRTQKMIAGAAILAVALKAFISTLKSWKGYFSTDKSKAWLKITTLAVGVIAFFATNLGFGIPWWQSLILALGGPAAVAVHEFSSLIPVLKGKAKMPVSDPPPPPANDVAPPTTPTGIAV